jgi:hypothetical protein
VVVGVECNHAVLLAADADRGRLLQEAAPGLLEGVPPGVRVDLRSGGMLRRVLVDNLAVAGTDEQNLGRLG